MSTLNLCQKEKQMGKLLTIPQNISMKRSTRLQHDMKASPSKTVERKLAITKKLTHVHARKQPHFNVSSSTDSLLHRLSPVSLSLYSSLPLFQCQQSIPSSPFLVTLALYLLILFLAETYTTFLCIKASILLRDSTGSETLQCK